MALFEKSETVELTVAGMTCGNCVAHVQGALKDVVGVRKAVVDLEAGSASVTVKPGTDRDELVAAVRDAGYAAE